MAIYKIFKACISCDGEGIRQIVIGSDSFGTEDCGTCLTTGKQEIGYIDFTDLEDKLDDILDKVNDIMEKLNE